MEDGEAIWNRNLPPKGKTVLHTGGYPVPYKKNCWWWFEYSIAREPKRVRFVASTMLWTAFMGIFYSILLADPSSSLFKYLRFGFFIPIPLSAFLNSWADIVQGTPWQMIGTALYGWGLILICSAFGIAPLTGQQDQVAAIVGTIGIFTVICGITLLGKENYEMIRRPVFGIQNFPFYGVITFGTGALIQLLSFISWYPSVSVSYLPVRSFSLLGLSFLTSASMMIWSVACFVLVDYQNAVLVRFPSTAVLRNHYTSAKVYLSFTLIGVLGSCAIYVGLAFSLVQGVLWVVFGGCLVAGAARLAVGLSFVRAGHIVMVLGAVMQSASFFVMAWFFANAATSGASDYVLPIIAGVIQLVGSAILLARMIYLSCSSFIVVSCTFFLLSDVMFSISGAVLIVLGALQLSSITTATDLLIAWGFLTMKAQILSIVHANSSKDNAEALCFLGSQSDPWKSDSTIPDKLLEAPEWCHDWVSDITDRKEVVIIGGGPTGLGLANEMGIRGVDAVMFDQKDTVVPDSRFFLCCGTTMEHMDRLGCAEKLVERGQLPTFGIGNCLCSGISQTDAKMYTHTQGYPREIAQRLNNEGSELATTRSNNCIWNFQTGQRIIQSAQEAVLVENAQRFPSLEMKFSNKLVDYRICPDRKSVISLVEDSQGRRRVLHSKYLVGCDGAFSTVSRGLATRFDGFTEIASARSTYFYAPKLLETLKGRLIEAQQYHTVIKGVGVGYIAQRNARDHLWTLVLIALYDGRSPGALQPEEMYEVVQKFIGPGIEFEVITDGRWRWNFLVARTLRKGPVLIAGDASHSWPPFAGNGGNTGYSDAFNLAWKLYADLKGWGGPHLLNSYEEERRDTGLRLAMAVALMVPKPSRALLGGAVLSLPILNGIAKLHWHFGVSGIHLGNNWSTGGTQMGLRYDFSPIVSGGNQDFSEPEDPTCRYIPKVVPGGRVLHVELSDEASILRLVSLTEYTLFLTDASAAQGAELVQRAFENAGAPLKFVDLSKRLLNARPGRRNELAASLWIRAKLVICRPDLFVGWTYDQKPVLTEDAAARLVKVLCGFEVLAEDSARMMSMTRWLTWKMVEVMKPMRHLFSRGIFVINECKRENRVKDNAKGNVVGFRPEQGIALEAFNGNNLVGAAIKDGVAATSGICHHCNKPIPDPEETLWLNNHPLHPQCIVQFRKAVGISEKICMYCCKRLMPGQTLQSVGQRQAHEECLQRFREECEAEEQGPEYVPLDLEGV